MRIRTLIENYRRDFINKTTKTPCNLVLSDWQLTQLITELGDVCNAQVVGLDSFMGMKIIKDEETIILAMS